jgi:hypothetical protein
MVLRGERAKGGRMIGVIEQSLGEIEHVAPAAAAPAPEPLAVIPPRAVDAQGRPMVVVERQRAVPPPRPLRRTGHTTGLEQVRDVELLAHRRPKIVVRSAHESRIALLPLPGTASGPSSVTGTLSAVQEARARSGKCIARIEVRQMAPEIK